MSNIRAKYNATPPTVADTQWTDLQVDENGNLKTVDGSIADKWSYAAATGGIDNTTTAVTVKAAAAAGIKNYIETLQIAHATLGATTEFAIRDGAGGTVLWRTNLHTTAIPTTTIVFDPPLSGTAATLLEVVTLTKVTGDVVVNLQGFTGP